MIKENLMNLSNQVTAGQMHATSSASNQYYDRYAQGRIMALRGPRPKIFCGPHYT